MLKPYICGLLERPVKWLKHRYLPLGMDDMEIKLYHEKIALHYYGNDINDDMNIVL